MNRFRLVLGLSGLFLALVSEKAYCEPWSLAKIRSLVPKTLALRSRFQSGLTTYQLHPNLNLQRQLIRKESKSFAIPSQLVTSLIRSPVSRSFSSNAVARAYTPKVPGTKAGLLLKKSQAERPVLAKDLSIQGTRELVDSIIQEKFSGRMPPFSDLIDAVAEREITARESRQQAQTFIVEVEGKRINLSEEVTTLDQLEPVLQLIRLDPDAKKLSDRIFSELQKNELSIQFAPPELEDIMKKRGAMGQSKKEGGKKIISLAPGIEVGILTIVLTHHMKHCTDMDDLDQSAELNRLKLDMEIGIQNAFLRRNLSEKINIDYSKVRAFRRFSEQMVLENEKSAYDAHWRVHMTLRKMFPEFGEYIDSFHPVSFLFQEKLNESDLIKIFGLKSLQE